MLIQIKSIWAVGAHTLHLIGNNIFKRLFRSIIHNDKNMFGFLIKVI